jgi:thiol-disulfide isomerase/thioredoxin
MKAKFILFVFALSAIVSVSFSQSNQLLQPGNWTAFLRLNDSIQLPFSFAVKTVNAKNVIVISNWMEEIVVDEVNMTQDSVNFKMPVFDSEFRCKNNGTSWTGVWINHARKDKNKLPFHANRIFQPEERPKAQALLSGKWEVDFSPGTKDSSKAIGVFGQEGCYLHGTFLTETGDYRYLSGFVKGTTMSLSCFDGAHAYYFCSKQLPDHSLSGDYYSGAHGYEKWTAKRNEKFELRNPDSLTYLKKGFDKVEFRFKNTDGKEVTLNDDKFKNKVVIIQIMGSWCPNCMDETIYLSELYEKEKTKGLEVVALAFEKPVDPERARQNVLRLKKRFNANYEFLLTGKSGSTQAGEALPMLNAVMAFPTTIYLDKKGRVRKIYTGFSGPGTLSYYEKFKEQNEIFLQKLLAE